MSYQIEAPSRLRQRIVLTASKSISNRVLIINRLSGNRTEAQNISDCDDTFVMQRALKKTLPETDIMAAGTAMRFLTAYFSVTEGETVLTGTPRMLQRPIRILVDALRTLGAKIEYVGQEGFPPLKVTGGKLKGGWVELSGTVSSQFVSALLLVGPTVDQGLTLRLTDRIVSLPYIDMTLQLMREFGAKADWLDERTIHVEPTGYRERSFTVENDWSGASYWYEMMALSADKDAEIILPGLFQRSIQGDARVKDFFKLLGVHTEETENEMVLTKAPSSNERLELNLENQPDLAQTLVVSCAMMGQPFRFYGLENLKIKETDRLQALKTELNKFGIHLNLVDDGTVVWDGQKTTPERNIVVETYEDHRMAMAFSGCCFQFPEMKINHPLVVSKSYPHFWGDLKLAGFKIKEV